MSQAQRRFWKYLTPAVLCFAIGLQAPLWHAARAAGLMLIVSVGFLIFSAISLQVDVHEESRDKKTPNADAVAKSKSQLLKKMRLSAALFICAACLLAPTAARIILHIR